MGEFNKAFINFVNFFLQYKNKYQDFNGNVLGGFKKNNNVQSYNILKDELSADITMETILADLVQLFNIYALNTSPFSINQSVVQFLDDCLNPSFKLSSATSGKISFNQRELSNLKRLKEKFTSVFSEPAASASSHSATNYNTDQLSLQSIMQSLNLLTQKVNSLESSNNTQSQSGVPPTFREIGIDQETGTKLERLINKKQRYNNISNVLTSHCSNSTAPSSYFYCYFPRPLLWYDQDFIDMHNTRIQSTQIAWLKEDIKFLQKSITSIDQSILNLKEENSSVDMDSVIKTIDKQVEIHLKKYMDSSSEKTNREIVMKYYTVKEHKSKEDTNVSSDSNENQRNAKRSRNRSKSNSSNKSFNQRQYNTRNRNQQNRNQNNQQHRSQQSQNKPNSQRNYNNRYNPHGSAFTIESPRVSFANNEASLN